MRRCAWWARRSPTAASPGAFAGSPTRRRFAGRRRCPRRVIGHPMRLAFLIKRKNYYRLLGPVVEEALRRGHAVQCWHDWSGSRDSVKEFPDVAPALSAGIPEVVPFQGVADLAERWRDDPPDAVLSIDAPDPEPCAAAKTRWVWLQYGADMLLLETAREGIADADSIAFYSDYWVRQIERHVRGADVAAGL